MNLYHLAYQEKTLLSLIRLRSISPDKELLRKIMLAIWFCALVASVLFRRLVALAPYPLSPRGEIVEHARDVRMCIMWLLLLCAAAATSVAAALLLRDPKAQDRVHRPSCQKHNIKFTGLG